MFTPGGCRGPEPTSQRATSNEQRATNQSVFSPSRPQCTSSQFRVLLSHCAGSANGDNKKIAPAAFLPVLSDMANGVQKCLNPLCDHILFIVGTAGPDYHLRGLDRPVNVLRDDRGLYIECPKCRARHSLRSRRETPEAEIWWEIDGLREDGGLSPS